MERDASEERMSFRLFAVADVPADALPEGEDDLERVLRMMSRHVQPAWPFSRDLEYADAVAALRDRGPSGVLNFDYVGLAHCEVPSLIDRALLVALRFREPVIWPDEPRYSEPIRVAFLHLFPRRMNGFCAGELAHFLRGFLVLVGLRDSLRDRGRLAGTDLEFSVEEFVRGLEGACRVMPRWSFAGSAGPNTPRTQGAPRNGG